jgi:glycosyltransferase involved in cell wall biosynthesis
MKSLTNYYLKALVFIFLLTIFVEMAPVHSSETEKSIVVVIPSYNNKKWYKKNLSTLFKQNYTNYKVIYLDDCSSDGTGKLVENFVKKLKQGHRFQLVKNSQRHGALQNLYTAIHSCADDDIVITYDGDDWFPNNNVLNIINDAYQSDDVWLTYGTYVGFPDRKTSGHSRDFPKNVIENNLFRQQTHPSHLRTFYAWLFKNIDIDDLLWDEKFYPMAWDLAMMFPMIEMAGERHKFIDKITYVYNQINPISDGKVDPNFQIQLDEHIRSLPRYVRLENKYDDPEYESSDLDSI